jgi:VWFA-related protein
MLWFQFGFQEVLEVATQMPRDAIRRLCCCTLAGFLSMMSFGQTNPRMPATAGGQTQANPQGTTSGSAAVLKVTTRLVVVDVVARTNKGDFVTDLKAEDFALTEDGKPQEIRSFNFQQPNEHTRPQISPLPAGVFTNQLGYRPAGALNVILLDALNSNLPDQALMRDAMVKFLSKLPDQGPISIYFLGTKLRLVQDFTSDPEVLKKAISNLKTQNSPVLNNPGGSSPISDLPPGGAANSLLAAVPALRSQILAFQAERSAAQTDYQVRYTLQALNSLGRALAGYPGRKNLIWISESFPFDILSENNNSSRSYSSEVASTGSLLSDAQVAVYPVDARGLVNYSSNSVPTAIDPQGAAVSTTLRGGLGATMNTEANALLAVHTTMNDLAEKTGGQAFYSRNDLDDAVRESINDGSTYYTLGYYPENKDWNGGFRKVHVKVTRPGTKLRYRIGYLALDRAAFTKANPARQDADLDQALNLDWPVATALSFQAQVFPPSPQTQNKVSVRFRIDPRDLNFEHGEDGFEHVAMLCAVRAFSTKDSTKIVGAAANKMEGPLRQEAYSKIISGFFPCQEQLELPPGDYVLRLGVRDNSTGLIGSATAQVSVPRTEEPQKPETKNP